MWMIVFRAIMVAIWCVIAVNSVQAREVKTYFFGNSLIHHLSDSDETTVPHWMGKMAAKAGHDFGVDGQWGFLRDFGGKPIANWSFRDVPGVWNPDRQPFEKAAFSSLIINPANFIQYQDAAQAYEGDNPTGASPLSAMLALIDAHGRGPSGARTIYIYEGWAEMSGFGDMAKYHAYNMGGYHKWYVDFVAKIRDARAGANVRLLPVARGISQLLNEAPLRDIPQRALYIDDAPHGTATMYLLAAAFTYAGVFDEAPPVDLVLPKSIHPLVRDNWATISKAAFAIHMADAGRGETTEVSVSSSALAEVKTVLPAGPEQGIINPSLAMGLNGIADWSTQHPFVNVMKTARPWIGHLPNQWGGWDAKALLDKGHLDFDGWPMSLPGDVDRLESFLLTDQPEGAKSSKARYRVTWNGEGDLKIGGRANHIEYGQNEAWFSYAPGEGLVAITIYATDPNGTGAYLRDIEVVREDHIALHEVGVLFNPDWINRIKDLRAARFMDWMFTNGSDIATWGARPVVSDYTYVRRGVPAEIMIALANQVGLDPWFNIPHMADDEYSQQFAELVFATLDPRLKVYVEYSNEMWNFTFTQTHWAAAQAKERWGRAAEGDGWMQFTGMRGAQIARVWGSVFSGLDASRLVRVVAVHTGWVGLEEPLLAAPLWVAETPGKEISPAAHFDAYAVSGYFGFEMGDPEGKLPQLRDWIAQSEATAEREAKARGLQRKALKAAIAPTRFLGAMKPAADAIREGSLKELIVDLWGHHARVARDNGMRLIMYEGGTHVTVSGAAASDELLIEFFKQFSYSPEMAGLYRELLDGWRGVGGTLFNAFVDVAPPSQYGSWGALRHLDDANPRWDVLMDENAISPDFETRDGAAFLHGVLRQGGPAGETITGTPQEDILLGGGGDDILVGRGNLGRGSDHLHGGAGMDTARLPGARAGYKFAMRAGALLATGPMGDTALFSIEALEFEDDPGRVYRLELPN